MEADNLTLDNSKPNVDNPYAYLERNQFTSEKFKIEVRGLPKFYGLAELKKFLNNKLNLKYSKLKPPKIRSKWVYICFRSEEERQNAIQIINGCRWKNSTLSASASTAVPDPLIKRRTELIADLNNEASEGKQVTNVIDKLRQHKLNIVPLCNVDYSDQLITKWNIVADVLKSLGKQLLNYNKQNFPVFKWLQNRLQQYDNFPCKLGVVKPSPVIHGYRNKCEFTIGINEETNEKTIGFRIATYARGTTSVCSVNDMPHVPQCMKDIVQVFELFVRQSRLDIFHPEDHSGYWRQLTIRLGTLTDQIMVIAGIHPQNLTDEELTAVKQEIVNLFTKGDGMTCNVSSLHVEFIAKKKSGGEQRRFEHLYGSATIIEKLLGLQFNVSPESFFQVNTAACEVLYTSVKELAGLTSDTTLLDVCSGTGTIGICLAKFCKRVIGIEREETAVKNAIYNGTENNVLNCEFHCGKVEDIMSSILSGISANDDIVAVVDPPRAGLHQKCIIQLRKAKSIKKIIYLACNPKAALNNFVSLGKPRSKTLLGEPFLLSAAIPVDMFPHTEHCELVLCFERYDNSNDNLAMEK